MVTPPPAIEWPAMLCPPHLIAISRSASRALRIAIATSSEVRGRAIRAGRRSIIAFQTLRAAP
jgi:hypothetical protein